VLVSTVGLVTSPNTSVETMGVGGRGGGGVEEISCSASANVRVHGCVYVCVGIQLELLYVQHSPEKLLTSLLISTPTFWMGCTNLGIF